MERVDETLERFFRCSRCGLPHSIDTSRCPVTGESLTRPEGPAPAPAPSIAVDSTDPMATRPSARRSEGEILTGQILDNKYAIGEPIGRGAMGTVYEGHHLLLGRLVAIKTISLPHQQREEMQRRFLDEGRALAGIAHPHVVQIYDLGLLRGGPYLVMERLAGETLEERLDARGALPAAEAATIARQILAGLDAVHQHGLVHRDLKPANVFLVRGRDGSPHVKLLDFGLSTPFFEGADQGASSGLVQGTPSYLAPEQARGEPVSPRADLWAAGVVLYEMLTGRLPFPSRSFNELMRHIATMEPPVPSVVEPSAAPLDAVVMRALSKRAGDRFAGARAMLEACSVAASASAEITVEPAAAFALIAEPDPRLAAAYRAVAGELGLVALTAEDGAEAREMLTTIGLPRLLLTNLALAGEDGFSLLRELRSIAPESVTTAVVVSPVSALRAAARERKGELGIAAVLDGELPFFALHEAVARALASAPQEPEPPPSPQAETLLAEAEGRRLERIAAMEIIDGDPPEATLQRLVEDTAQAFGVPIAVVSLVLRERQWYKAHVGLEGDQLTERGTPRSVSFCQHVVQSRTALIVPDARAHPFFADNTLVREGTLGAYAGAPLITPDGDVLGTLCIMDKRPRPFRREVIDDLGALARRVAGELELSAARAAERKSGAAPQGTTRGKLLAVVANLESAVLLLGPDRRVVLANQPLAELAGVEMEDLEGLPRAEVLRKLAPAFADPDDFLRRVRVSPSGPFAAREDFVAVRPTRRIVRWSAKPVEMRDGVGQLETYMDLPLPPG